MHMIVAGCPEHDDVVNFVNGRTVEDMLSTLSNILSSFTPTASKDLPYATQNDEIFRNYIWTMFRGSRKVGLKSIN